MDKTKAPAPRQGDADATLKSAAGLSELRVDDAAVLAALLAAVSPGGRTLSWRRRRLAVRARSAAGAVHHAGEAMRFLLEPPAHVLHLRVVLLLDGLAALFDEALERRQIRTLDLVLVLVERLFDRVAEVVELVSALDLPATLLVLRLVLLGFFHHLLDLGLVEARVRGDGDLLVLARGRVLRVHAEDAVRVDVERHLA